MHHLRCCTREARHLDIDMDAFFNFPKIEYFYKKKFKNKIINLLYWHGQKLQNKIIKPIL